MNGTDGRWQYKKLELSALGKQYYNYKCLLHTYNTFLMHFYLPKLPSYYVQSFPCVYLPNFPEVH